MPKQTRLSPDVSFASVSFAVDDVRRHVVPCAAECVHPRDCVQLLRRAEVAQLHVTDVVSQYVGTYHLQFACLYVHVVSSYGRKSYELQFLYVIDLMWNLINLTLQSIKGFKGFYRGLL